MHVQSQKYPMNIIGDQQNAYEAGVETAFLSHNFVL